MVTPDEFGRFLRLAGRECEECEDSTDGRAFCVVTAGGACVTLFDKSKLDEALIRGLLDEEPSN